MEAATMQKVVDVLELALLAGSVASLYFTPKVARWMIAKAKNFVAVLQALSELPQVLPSLGRLTALDSSVKHVLREVLPNGGSSMRDTVNKIASTQEDIKRSLALQNGVMRAHYDADGVYARFETDGIGRNTWVNRTYMTWVNRSIDQVIGYGWINCIAPAYREHVRDEWELAISERREFAMRYKLRDAHGHEFEVDCVAVPVAGDDPHIPERWVGHIVRLEPTNARHS